MGDGQPRAERGLVDGRRRRSMAGRRHHLWRVTGTWYSVLVLADSARPCVRRVGLCGAVWDYTGEWGSSGWGAMKAFPASLLQSPGLPARRPRRSCREW